MGDKHHTCPCCGEELPLGLFYYKPQISIPPPLAAMRADGVGIKEIGNHFMMAQGRLFLLARATFPLDWKKSPVTVGAWVEVGQSAASELTTMEESNEEIPVIGSGRLACDLPGFPGSLGAEVSFAYQPGESHARIHTCGDARIADFNTRDHKELGSLYRRAWGGSAELIPDRPELRAGIGVAWHEIVGRPIFRRELEPPAAIAGTKPLEILIAPPLDTGGEAIAASVGIVNALRRQPVELITYARNADDHYLESFGELCYLPFISNNVEFVNNDLIGQNQGLPGVPEMIAWLICESWWLDSLPPSIEVDGLDVKLQVAIPVRPEEVAFAAHRGPGALRQELELNAVDVTDLKRPQFMPGPGS